MTLQNRQLRESLKRAGRQALLRHTTEAYYRAIAEIFREICATNNVCDERPG